MAPGACKIRRECNVLEVPIQIIHLGIPKRGDIPSEVDQNYDGMFPDHPIQELAKKIPFFFTCIVENISSVSPLRTLILQPKECSMLQLHATLLYFAIRIEMRK